MPWLIGAGTGTRIARVVMEEEYSVMGARGGKGRRRGEGRGQGQRLRRAARRVPARAGRTAAEHTPRPWSAAASDLHEGGRRASRVVAGQGGGGGATPGEGWG